MKKDQKEYIIIVPPSIIEDLNLSQTEKLMLALTFIFDSKRGYNILSNIDIAKLLMLDVNTVGKYRRRLVSEKYEYKKEGKYYLTNKYKETEVQDKTRIFIPSEVYSKKIPSGSKLLWGMYNSLSNKGTKESYASREYYSKRLNCSVDTISKWLKKLESLKLVSKRMISGKDTKQVRVKTHDFTKEKIITSVPKEKRNKIWKEYIGNINNLKKFITDNKSVWEFTKDLYSNLIGSENQKEEVFSLLQDIDKIGGNEFLDLLKQQVEPMLQELLKE